MNILLISPKYFPSVGGVEIQMELLANELISRKHCVTVISSGDQFPMPNTPLDYLNGYLFIRNSIGKIKKQIISDKIDIIHVHQFEMSVSMVHQLKQITDIPIVVTVHTLLSINEGYKKSCGLIRKVVRAIPIQYIEMQSIRDANHVICISDGFGDYCKKLNSNVSVIPPAINLDKFTSDISTQSHSNLIVCPGRLSPEKGQIVLIWALSYLRNSGIDAKVLFIGSGKDADIKILKDMVARMALDDYVTFLPSQSYDTIESWYRTADVIAIPSFSESFGLVALENMALGNIVVASDVGGLSKLIEHNKNGLLFEAGNVIGLTEMIRSAFYNNHTIMRTNAIRKSKDYGIGMAVDKIEMIYKEVLQ